MAHKCAAVLCGGVVAIATACTSAATPQIVRRVDGQPIVGPVVSPFSYEWFIRGEIALERGDLESAAEAFHLARAGPEEDPLVLSRLAEVLNRLGRREAADLILQEARTQFPQAESVWMASGTVAESRGERDEALRAFERAEAAAPESEAPVLALARLLGTEAPGRAEAALERFLSRMGRGSSGAHRAQLEIALLRGDATRAEAAVRSLLWLAPARLEEILRVAEALMNDGQPALALRLVDAAGSNRVPVRLRVRVLLAAGRRNEAEAALTRSSDRAFGGALEQARLFIEAGRPDRALELAEATSIADPSPEANIVRALAEAELGQRAVAARRLAAIPEGVRGYSESRLALSRALAEGGLTGVAREVLKSALDGSPDDPDLVRRGLAELRAVGGDADAAVALYGEGTEAASAAARAEMLDLAGQLAEANVAWAEVDLGSAELTQSARLRAHAEQLAASGARDEAVEVLTTLIRYSPADLVARARLVELAAAAGRAEAARRAATDVLRLTADPQLRARVERITRGL